MISGGIFRNKPSSLRSVLAGFEPVELGVGDSVVPDCPGTAAGDWSSFLSFGDDSTSNPPSVPSDVAKGDTGGVLPASFGLRMDGDLGRGGGGSVIEKLDKSSDSRNDMTSEVSDATNEGGVSSVMRMKESLAL